MGDTEKTTPGDGIEYVEAEALGPMAVAQVVLDKATAEVVDQALAEADTVADRRKRRSRVTVAVIDLDSAVQKFKLATRDAVKEPPKS